MGKSALIKKEMQDCFDVLQLISEEDTNSSPRRESFTRFPNGFYLNDSIDADSFLTETIKEPSKKDKLSKFLISSGFLKNLGTTSFQISIPKKNLQIKEKVIALKLLNESLILWTENFVYKIPTSVKAEKRIEMTKESVNTIRNSDTKLHSFFLLPKTITISKLSIQFSKKCQTFSLSSDSIIEIDRFLSDYFTTVFKLSTLQDNLTRGLEHGDLHFRNLLKDKSGKLYLTDLDLVKANGFPFLDLMHFVIHMIRTQERTTQHKPLESFLEDKKYLYDKLVSNNFHQLSELWQQYYQDEYIGMYMQSRIEWFRINRVVADELIQLEDIQKRFNL